MRCPVCSAEVDLKQEIFCNNCGTNMKQYIIPSTNQPATQPKKEVPAKKKKNNSSTVLIICLCALIGAVVICITAVSITVISSRETKEKASVSVTAEEDTNYEGYLFPSHNTYLTYEILSEYTSSEIDLICNEIYARHGQIFKKQKNIDYFSAQPWYEPRYESMDYVTTLFNETEKKNIATIVAYRENRGWENELDNAL